ncbi:ead/Ea22-like family protein [Salmonella enterica subsp. enterica serovar Ohio]|nr:ead/Ea22-like family protein [Salmonella enterica]EDQ1199975.1 ead/Ea22-like family protein [Salmonella enterica subsp. enterica serovar Ohio]EAQ2671564.1 ead/Ea22-like family protein [Salmonella enterica]EAS0602932.1 ead/Ea22-like family protein [Salmonella enterica]EAU9121908.1 ead/Ea22-like family protein [Salmonella enterica]
MTIDKRALREVAERATQGPWKLFSDIDTKTFSIHTPRDKRCENVIKWGGFDCQPNAEANAEFIAAFNPKVALALLDEVESKQTFQQAFFRQSLMYDVVAEAYEDAKEQIAKDVEIKARLCRESNSLHDRLREAEKRIAEQSAIVAAAEKLVRCKGRYHSELNYRALAKLFGVVTPDLPPLEHENVHYADAAEVEITALRQRIQELEAKLETADKLQDSAFRDGLKAGFSYGQTDDQSGFAQCMSAYSTRAGIKIKGE